jgi:hypothetical protein
MVKFEQLEFTFFYTEKNYLFEGVLYQYFERLYYERCHRRNITISITILFVRGEREKNNNKTDILRVLHKRKKKLLLKKKYGFVREDYSIHSRRLFFSVYK